MKLRIGRPLLDFMEGGQLFQTPSAFEKHGYGEAGWLLVLKVHGAPRRKDGSRIVDLTDAEADVVSSYAGAMDAGARDEIGGGYSRSHNGSMLGEVRSAQAWFRQLEVRT